MHTEPKLVTEGARLLRAHLARSRLSIMKFSKSHGLDRVQVQRVLNGDLGRRVSVDFAEAIEKATGGEVPVHSWNSSTLGPVESDAPDAATDPSTAAA